MSPAVTDQPLLVTDLSVSRVKVADSCMRKYAYQYVHQIPAPTDRAAKVFGTVVHLATERWYVGDYRSQPLRQYVDTAWWEHLPQEVAIAVRHCIQAEEAQQQLVEAIKVSRPGVKGPRQTKAFLESAEFGRFHDCRDELLRAQEACEEMGWAKDENAFQAYCKSVAIADQLQARWQRLPPPLVVEKEFSIEFAGLRIRGRIDQIRADPDPTGQLVHGIEGLDLKTGRQPLTQMDAFLQAFLYNEACLVDPELPEPDYWTFLLARHNRPQHGKIDRDRHARLAEQILHSVKRRVESQDWAPHFGFWCKNCDFAALCSAEIGLWDVDSDSLVLGADT